MPGQNKNQRIAIIGAGISGLYAAQILKKKGYNNITIFEAEDRVGGKICSTQVNGLSYELGALFNMKGMDRIGSLIKQYNLPVTGQALSGYVYYNGEVLSVFDYLSKIGGKIKITISQIKFARLLFKYKFLKNMDYLGVDPELFVSLKKYSKEKKIEPMLPMFDMLLQMLCSGYADSTPAIYAMKLLRGIISYFVKNQLNATLGLNISTIETFDNGFDSLAKTMAKEFDVKLNSKITRINREINNDKFKISLQTGIKTEIFDCLFISSLPVQTMKFLDINEDEKEIFSRVKYYHYHVLYFRGSVPLKESAVYFDPDYLAKKDGFPTALMNHRLENNIYTTYHMTDGSFSNNEIENKVHEAVEMMGGNIDEIIENKSYIYFPHFLENDLIEIDPYTRLEKMQGLNGTYYIGALLTTEGTEPCAQYAENLVNKYF